MYTELIFGAELKEDTPEIIINTLKYMIGDLKEKPLNFPLPDGRYEVLFRSASYYHLNRPVSKIWFDDIAKQWSISTRSNIKNYENEIETFLEWIKPHIDSGVGLRDMYAIVTYEEADEPTIHYLQEN